jgi:HEAT repeat protein
MNGNARAAASVATILRTQGLQFVKTLQSVLRLFILYSSNHPQAQSLIQRALVSLNQVLEQTGVLSIGFQFNSIILNSLPVSDSSLSWLAGEFTKRGIGFLAFSRGMDQAALANALSVLAMSPDAIEQKGGLAAFLRGHPLQYVRIVPIQAAADDGSLAVITSAEEASAIANVPQWLMRALEQTKSQGGTEAVGARELQELGNMANAELTPEQRALLPRLQQGLANVIRKADGATLSEMMRGLDAQTESGGEEVLRGIMLQALTAALAGADLPQAERTLRSAMNLEKQPEKLMQAVPAECKEEVRQGLKGYVAWLSQPMGDRLAALSSAPAARHFRWLLAEIEHSCGEGQAQEAAGLLAGLIAVEGPADEAARADVFTQCHQLLPRLCGAGLPPNAPQLVEALAGRLRREQAPAAAAALAESLGILAQQAAEREDFALATAAAAAVAEAAREASPRAEAVHQVWRRLLKPQTLSQLVSAWVTKGNDPKTRQIVPLLKRTGDQAARELLELMEKEPQATRRLRLLQLVKLLGRGAVQPLVEKLAHPLWYVVRNAVIALGELGEPELADHLAPALSHPEERLQKAALAAIQKSRSPNCGLILARALSALKPALLEIVLDELLLLKEPAAVPYLERLIRQPQPGVQQRLLEKATAVLAAIETLEAIECLLACADETSLDMPLRQAAVRGLARINTPAGERALAYFAKTSADPALAEEAQKLMPVWQYG